jgi:hypothetical protein
VPHRWRFGREKLDSDACAAERQHLEHRSLAAYLRDYGLGMQLVVSRGTRAAVTALMLLAACNSAAPGSIPASATADTQPSAPAAATASATSSPEASLTLRWTEHAFAGDVRALIADGDRFVAVGLVGDEQRAAWTSNNGVTWDQHAVPAPSTAHCDEAEPVCIERSAQMGPMVRLHDTLYSFGATAFFNDYIKAVGWRWTDGQDWQVIESSNPIYAGGAFRAAATSDSSIFAVTHAGYEFTERHWLWQPQTSWRQVGANISFENPIQFLSVAWRQMNFLAVGGRWTVDGTVRKSTPAAWSSIDGGVWTEIAPPDSAGMFCSVTAARDAFIALGLDGQGLPMTWSWTPELGWSAGSPLPTSTPLQVFTDPSFSGCIGGVVELVSGFAAFFCDGSTLTWVSRDGTTWADAGTLEMCASSSSVGAIGDTIVAFGKSGGAQHQVLFAGSAVLAQD